MWMQKQSKYENMAYVALWGLLLAAPLLSLYARMASNDDQSFDWQEIFMVWRHLALFLAFFLVHNFILAPLLIYRHKRWLYGLSMLCMIGLFAFFQFNQRPHEFRHQHRPMHRMEMHNPPPHEHRPDFHKPRHNRPPGFMSERDIAFIVMLILMCGINLGAKYYFKTRDDQKKLLRLEKENLEQQLEYLKYQINPHFFMNTLNNIHALIDIDTEKAKSTILELSKMMRFVLYEGNKKGVPLTREFDFIRNYITLMRLRYTDKVKIQINLPQQAPDLMIPPLMLITFIENAFKHGISYQHDSFIDVKVEIAGTELHFSCRNSKAEKNNEEKRRVSDGMSEMKGGVGLANVRQRLKLLYDNRFTLKIQDNPDYYSVQLNIPLS
jgi:hypothetical protein